MWLTLFMWLCQFSLIGKSQEEYKEEKEEAELDSGTKTDKWKVLQIGR